MTVKELIEKLQSLPTDLKELPVGIEGCDCIGKADDISYRNDNSIDLMIEQKTEYILITRR